MHFLNQSIRKYIKTQERGNKADKSTTFLGQKSQANFHILCEQKISSQIQSECKA